MDLILPSKLRLRETLEFCRHFKSLPKEGTVNVDFRQMGFAGPFALLLLSSCIQRARNENQALRFLPRHYAQHRYFGHMGLFRAMGFDYGKEPGAAAGSENYLPITIREVVSIRNDSKDTGRPLGELVEEEARSLAEILSRSRSGPVFDTLAFALREIIRNTVEHSRSPAVEWCAQYWPNQDRVEIAVLDRGVGIHSSLRSNSTLGVKDERHAINLALMPGVSCNVRLGEVQEFRSVWQNSGFGLFMTQRMCRFGGDFFLASGASGKFLDRDQSRWFDFGHLGTAVRMVLKPSSIGSLKEALARFEEDAKRVAKANNLQIPDASTASRMIRLNLYDQ